MLDKDCQLFEVRLSTVKSQISGIFLLILVLKITKTIRKTIAYCLLYQIRLVERTLLLFSQTPIAYCLLPTFTSRLFQQTLPKYGQCVAHEFS